MSNEKKTIRDLTDEEIRYKVVKKLLDNAPDGTDIATILNNASRVMEFLETGNVEQKQKQNGRKDLY